MLVTKRWLKPATFFQPVAARPVSAPSPLCVCRGAVQKEEPRRRAAWLMPPRGPCLSLLQTLWQHGLVVTFATIAAALLLGLAALYALHCWRTGAWLAPSAFAARWPCYACCCCCFGQRRRVSASGKRVSIAPTKSSSGGLKLSESSRSGTASWSQMTSRSSDRRDTIAAFAPIHEVDLEEGELPAAAARRGQALAGWLQAAADAQSPSAQG